MSEGEAGAPAEASLEVLPLAVVLVAEDGVVQFMNNAARALIDVGEDAVGRSFRSLHPGVGWNRVWKVLHSGPTDGPVPVSLDMLGGPTVLDVTVSKAPSGASVVVLVPSSLQPLRADAARKDAALREAHRQLVAAREELTRTDEDFASVIRELESATAELARLHDLAVPPHPAPDGRQD